MVRRCISMRLNIHSPALSKYHQLHLLQGEFPATRFLNVWPPRRPRIHSLYDRLPNRQLIFPFLSTYRYFAFNVHCMTIVLCSPSQFVSEVTLLVLQDNLNLWLPRTTTSRHLNLANHQAGSIGHLRTYTIKNRLDRFEVLRPPFLCEYLLTPIFALRLDILRINTLPLNWQ